jgi:hypothetical protein
MPRSRRAFGHIATACLLAISCDSSGAPTEGSPITDVQLCMFRVGRTTPHEVIAVLGPPETSSSTGQTLILIYHHADRARHLDEFVTFEFDGYVLRDVSSTTTGGNAARTIPSCVAVDASVRAGTLSQDVAP